MGYFCVVFTSLLMFNKPKSLWDSNPVTITLSHKTLFCWCSNCLTWLPGSNLCLACKSAPRMCLTITFLSTETTLWQKMYSRKEKKKSFLFFAFCKSGGSWKQPHMLIIRITTREFNLTEGRERGPPRGSPKVLGKTEHETTLHHSWVTGERGLWKTELVLLQTPRKDCEGGARNADKQSGPGPHFHAGGGRLTKSGLRPAAVPASTLNPDCPLAPGLCDPWLCSQGSGGMRTFYFPLLWLLLDSQQECVRMQASDLSSDSAWLRKGGKENALYPVRELHKTV